MSGDCHHRPPARPGNFRAFVWRNSIAFRLEDIPGVPIIPAGVKVKRKAIDGTTWCIDGCLYWPHDAQHDPYPNHLASRILQTLLSRRPDQGPFVHGVAMFFKMRPARRQEKQPLTHEDLRELRLLGEGVVPSGAVTRLQKDGVDCDIPVHHPR